MDTIERTRKHAAGVLAQATGRAFAHALARAVAPLGLAPAPYALLSELWIEDGLTQRALSDRLGIEQATVASTLARMTRDGLVTREPHPRDRRAVVVRLTARAAALRKPAKAAAREVAERALAGLSKKEQERFLATLARVAAALRAPPGEGAGARTGQTDLAPTRLAQAASTAAA